MLKFFILISLIAGLTVLNGCRKADNSFERDVTEVFTPLFADDEPGAVVLIAKGDSVIYARGFGKATLDPATDIDTATIFNICSISKQFSALALLKLQEQGLLSLDDTVARFFPEYHSPLLRKITLRQMMSHTSGIPDTRPRTEAQWKEYRAKYPSQYETVEDYRHYCLWEESCRYLDGLDSLAFEPGTQYEYQNPTFQLVLPIVERVTGKPFTQWMHDNFFTPAGMRNTTYLDPANPVLPHQATGYEKDSAGIWRECDYGEANFFPTKADGGIYTTAPDFLRYERALFGNRLVSAESLEQATTPIIRTDLPDTHYGLGLFIEDKPGFPRKIFHTGDNGGFFTYEGYYPSADIFYCIFANRADWSREDTAAALDRILRSHHLLP